MTTPVVSDRHVETEDQGRVLRLYREGRLTATVRSESTHTMIRAMRLWLAGVPIREWLIPVTVEIAEVPEELVV